MNEENNRLELLSIGDAAMDVYMSPTESEAMCSVDKKECLICFTYGDKIPVRSLDFSVGGNAANNSVGATRLGINCGLVSTLGGDMIGDQIVGKLEEEKVDLTFTIQQPTANSNYSVVINYSGERTIFTHHAPRSYEFPVHLPEVPWVYLTSMSESFGPFYKHIADWKHGKNTKLAFNPGSRQLRAGNEALADIMEQTYLIYVNRQEAELLTGLRETHGNERDLLKALSGLGPQTCVITDGGNGSYLYDGERCLHCSSMPVDAYERTGAGDAFGSGCLAALIKGKDFDEALLWGTVNAASVIGYIGPQKGLLREDEIAVWLERAKSCEVRVEEI
jgi:ribokinase